MFLNQSFGRPTLTMDAVKGWATDVCARHVSNGEDPTTLLTKISSENSLTPHQIEVLAGEINKTIHAVKYAEAEEKYHAANFPLANAKEVVASLQVQPTVKTASAVEFVPMTASAVFPDPVRPEYDFFAAFGVKPEELSKTAESGMAAKSRHENKAKFQKMASLARQSQDEVNNAETSRGLAELAFIKSARSMVLEGSNTRERFVKLCEVDHAIKQANMYEVAKPSLAKLAYALGAEGLILPEVAEKSVDFFLTKTADQTAPEHLISPSLRARVVNGNHPLLITLKTYADACEREMELKNRHSIINDKLQIMEQHIRAL